jgi:tellurite methyltransferase
MMSVRSSWNDRYAARETRVRPAAFIAEREHLLPATGRALDVAGGSGRHAVWLARRGFEVTLVDISDVALARAEAAATEASIALTTIQADLSNDPLPSGRFEVIIVVDYLDRDVWSALPSLLAPGGLLLACQPTVRNLERHPHPSARWLLDEGEIDVLASVATEADPDLRIVEVTEGWTGEGRHEAQLVLRRS